MSHPPSVYVHKFAFIALEETPCTWLSTSQMLTSHFLSRVSSFYCSFANLRQWRLHHGKLLCIPAYPMATLSFWYPGQEQTGGLVMFAFRPASQTQIKKKKKRERGFIDRDTVFAGEKNIQWRQCTVRMFYPYQHHPSLTPSFSLFFSCNAPMESWRSAAAATSHGVFSFI